MLAKRPPEPFELLAVPIALALVGGLIWLLIRNAKQRTDGFRRFAEAKSLRFIGQTSKFQYYFSVFDLFSRRAYAGTTRFTNMIHGPIGDCDIWIFDYFDVSWFTRGSRQSVVCIESEGLFMPRFSVLPVDIAHPINGANYKRTARQNLRRMTGMLKLDEIELADRREFYERFRIGGPNAPAIRRLFATSITDLLEQLGSVSVEGAGRKLLVYRESHVVSAADLPDIVEEALVLYASLRTDRATIDAL